MLLPKVRKNPYGIFGFSLGQLSLFYFLEQADYQLASLSHYIKQRASGYKPLPDFPEVPPPGEVRNVEPLPKTDTPKPRRGVVSSFVLNEN